MKLIESSHFASSARVARATLIVALAEVLLASCGGSSPPASGATAPAVAAVPQAALPVAADVSPADDTAPAVPNLLPSINDSGIAATYSTAGMIDRSGPFFQSLGTNGRSCASCHVQAEGWTITPPGVQLRFALSAGSDPIFRTNDGSNSPHADGSTVH